MSLNDAESLRLDRSLAQQMHITDFEVEMRKQLFEITQDDADILISFKSGIANKLTAIVDEFYLGQRKVPEIALLIGDSETFRRLQVSMRIYIMDIFCGVYDAEYVNKRLRIGKVHKRIGVSPKLYIYSMYSLERILFKYLQTEQSKETLCDSCNGNREALRKLLAFDLHLVMETYTQGMLDEVISARNDVSRYAGSLETVVADRTRQLQGLSRMDDLTGVGNQRAFHEDLRRELSVASRLGLDLTLLYFDLNKFKSLNDSKGHQAGDAILRKVGQSMREVIRETDTCYRYGGDEFAVLLKGASLKDAHVFSQRLIEAYDKGETEGITFSIGLAQAGFGHYPDNDALLKLADASMYCAKEKSREDGSHVVDKGSVCQSE